MAQATYTVAGPDKDGVRTVTFAKKTGTKGLTVEDFRTEFEREMARFEEAVQRAIATMGVDYRTAVLLTSDDYAAASDVDSL